MESIALSRGTAAPATAERRALLAGSQLAAVERFTPLLRRANFVVHRTSSPSDALQRVAAGRLDLLIVALPLPGVREILETVRGPGSPCLHASMVLVGDAAQPELTDERITRLANRVVTQQAPAEEIERTLSVLLEVAPRIDVSGTARVRRSVHEAPRQLRLENLSSSGMLLSGRDPLPLGCLFGFELELPEQAMPIRGQARVVRHAAVRRPGEQGIGASFVALGGDGPETLRRIVLLGRHAAVPEAAFTVPEGVAAAPAAAPPPSRGPATAARDRELAALREELAELEPFLDDLLRQGLPQRLAVADWYHTGVELGLESLAAFAAILEKVYKGQSGPPESARRIADLLVVRQRLAEFAQPQRGLDARVEILVALRPALERLLRELGEAPAVAPTGRAAERGVVQQLAADIQRVLRARRSLGALRALLGELDRPRFLVARGALRRRARDLYDQYRGFGAHLGIAGPETLTSRAGRRSVRVAAEREAQRLEALLAAIHDRVYPPRLRQMASGDVAVDLSEQRLEPVLAKVLAAGHEYLARAYSAYRHALELTGADGALLDRAASLAAAVANHPGTVAAPRPSASGR